ncbi:hypothetical protein ACWDUN_03775 [Mycobacterium sp. NPDC003323]
MRNLSGTTVAYIGFIFGVVGFMALGIFIAGWAAGSWLAAVPAGIAVGAFIAAVVEIRIAGRREGGLWGKPIDLATYKARYRDGAARRTRPRHWPVRSAGLRRYRPRRRTRHPAQWVRGRYTHQS